MTLPVIRNLVVGDGQVAAAAASILTGRGDVAMRYNFTFTNVESTGETLVLTYSRDGGTPRRIRSVLLAAGETFELGGLPVNRGDTVYAVTSNALSVDYLVSVAAEQAPLTSAAYDADGLPRVTPQILEQLALVFGQ